MEQPRMVIFARCWQGQRNGASAPSVWWGNSWYSSLDNLKVIREYGWIWLTRLKRNRHINPDNTANRPLCEVEIAASGTVVYLKGYGFVKVFKIVAPDGDIDYWATNDLTLGELQRLQFAAVCLGN